MPWYLHYWFKSVLLLFLLTITQKKYFSSSPKFLYNYIVFEFILFLVVQPQYSENYIAIISCTWEWASNTAFLVGGYPTRYFSSRFVWLKFIVELNEIYGCFLQKKKKNLNEATSLSTQISPGKTSTLLKLFSSKFLLYIKITSTLCKRGVCHTHEETTCH